MGKDGEGGEDLDGLTACFGGKAAISLIQNMKDRVLWREMTTYGHGTTRSKFEDRSSFVSQANYLSMNDLHI